MRLGSQMRAHVPLIAVRCERPPSRLRSVIETRPGDAPGRRAWICATDVRTVERRSRPALAGLFVSQAETARSNLQHAKAASTGRTGPCAMQVLDDLHRHLPNGSEEPAACALLSYGGQPSRRNSRSEEQHVPVETRSSRIDRVGEHRIDFRHGEPGSSGERLGVGA